MNGTTDGRNQRKTKEESMKRVRLVTEGSKKRISNKKDLLTSKIHTHTPTHSFTHTLIHTISYCSFPNSLYISASESTLGKSIW